MHLGQIVKKFREDNNMTMDEFAKSSGLSKGYISMLEKNINPQTSKNITPSVKTIRAVAQAIGMDFNELIDILDDDHHISLYDETELTTFEDSIIRENFREYIAKTMAAHAIVDLTEDEQEQLVKFARFLKSQRDTKE